MKLPNGYGSVSKLSGRRRRPYVIRVKGKILGYSKTRKEGLDMLAEYNKSPWDIDKRQATFSDVYEQMLEDRKNQVSEKTLSLYKGKYKKCAELYDIPYCQLRTFHFTSVIEGQEETFGAKNNMKKFLRAMDKTASDHDIILKQYTESLPVYTADTFVERVPFSEEEIRTLWDHPEIEDVDLVLILIYLGMRISEFASLKIEDIDLKEHILRGGSKTKAGRNRVIPIHPRIEPLIKKRIEQAKGATLLNYGDKAFRNRFHKVMEKLKMSHIPHECRHTLRTRLDNINTNPNVIDLILGHKGPGTGERVYTHKTIEQLREAMNRLE